YYMSRVDITTKKFREELIRGRMSKRVLYRGTVTTIIGVTGVILSAQLIVIAAGNIISFLGISQTFLGATVVAVGTSLPELALSLRAINERRLGLAFGNAVGSNFANITLVLGSLISVAPFQLDPNVFLDMIIFSLLANIMLWYFLSIKWIEWKTGLIFFTIYILFIASITPSIYV
ncbi:MAG: sodium:calcium antiporter, partial [Nitrososphaerales archaeon]